MKRYIKASLNDVSFDSLDSKTAARFKKKMYVTQAATELKQEMKHHRFYARQRNGNASSNVDVYASNPNSPISRYWDSRTTPKDLIEIVLPAIDIAVADLLVKYPELRVTRDLYREDRYDTVYRLHISYDPKYAGYFKHDEKSDWEL